MAFGLRFGLAARLRNLPGPAPAPLPDEAPANSVRPSISGDAKVGAVATLDDGLWTGRPTPTLTRQVERYTAGAWSAITGATGTTYTYEHEGAHRLRVTASNGIGPAVVEYSAEVVIGTTQTPPTFVADPIIHGNAYTGSTIYVMPGVTDGTETITYAYQTQYRATVDDAWADFATGSTFVPNAAGQYSCVVTPTGPGGTGESRRSNTMTVSVAPAAPTTHYSHDFATVDSWVVPASCSITGGAFWFNNGASNVTADRDITALALPAGKYTVTANILDGDAGAGATRGNVSFRMNNGAFLQAEAAFTDVLGAVTATITTTEAPAELEIRVTRQDAAMNIKVDDIALKSGDGKAPELDYAPRFAGNATVGETLRLTYGVWFASPEPAYTVLVEKWNGSAWVAAPGTNNTLEYVPSEAGDYRPTVTANNGIGASVKAIGPAVTVSAGAGGTGDYVSGRILIDDTNGAPEPAIAKLEFLLNGSVVGGTAFASSEAGAQYAASNVLDADSATVWSPMLGVDAVPHVGVKFTTASKFDAVAITAANIESLDSSATPRSIRVQSSDGTEHVTRLTIENATGWTAGERREFAVPILAPPAAPTIGTATAGDAQATVTWTAPADTGGSAIIDYRITASTGVTSTGHTGTSGTITGLTNGTAATFTVAARNSDGYGPESAASNSVTPVANPVASLFAAGEVGVWYDPSDFSTMFQDSAGLTAVTAVGDPVGLIQDKSGNGYHATQTTVTKRPLLQQDANGNYYLDFDGVDDALSTAAIAFGTDKMTTWFGASRDTSTTSPQMVYEVSANAETNDGTCFAYLNSDYGFVAHRRAGGANGYTAGTGAILPVSPSSGVFVVAHDLAGTTAVTETPTFRLNAADVARSESGSADTGSGTFGTHPLYIGARNDANFFLDGRLYGLILRGAASTTQEITDVETWLSGKTAADEASLGSELVVNGDFAVDTGWSVGAAWSISAGVATYDNAGGYTQGTLGVRLSRALAMGAQAAKTYRVTYTVTQAAGDGVRVQLGYNSSAGEGAVIGTTRTSPGTYTQDMTLAAGTDLYLRFDGLSSTTSVTSIDNVSVREVL